MPQSERRRPPPRTSGSDAESDDDEALKGSSDELLRWAEEVMRKADASQSKAEFVPCSRPTARRPVQAHDPDVSSNSAYPRVRPPLSPGARERKRKEDELRSRLRQLNEESEQDCERMASEEASRRRQFAEESERMRRRVNSAAEEMRSNFTRVSFEASGRRHAPRGEDGSARGGSVPPPRTSAFHMSGGPSGSDTSRAREAEDAAAAWARFEAVLDGGAGPIHFESIPWPRGTGGITGVLQSDSRPVAKRKLAGALRRWHPDKWKRILDRVPEVEQARVMEHVKSIAQRLLDEKAKLTGLGGVLH